MDNNLNTAPSLAPGQVAENRKPLWLAIGGLGAAVLALGGTLAYTQLRPANPAPEAVAVAPQTAPAAVEPASKSTGIITESAQPAPRVVATPAPHPAPRPAPRPAPQVAARDAYPTGNIGQATPGNYPVAQPARPVCQNCGSVESVTAVQRAAPTNGVGVVAGGVLGAIVGNQIGHGNGRAAATVLGAVGGGYAGNAIEKNVRKTTAYQVRVRMEDGSVRTVELPTAPSVGARVIVEGNSLRGADGANYGAAPAPAPAPTGGGYSGSAY